MLFSRWFYRSSLKKPPRLTDLPYFKWLGFSIRFFKTFDVLIFKFLQFFDLYRPKKSIIGIPSLATRGLAMLQAIVYNGTQEEVLGFTPRRLLHRVLKGVPDVESFERVRFQVALSDRVVRTVEASTETRGFIHLQLPWQVTWELPKVAWLRMEPLGVETLLGTVRLGEYEIFSSPVFFLGQHVKYLVISDIDDTIKDSRIGETTGWKDILRGLIRGHYYRYEAIEGMSELYQDLAAKGAMIIYVTSTPYQLGPFLLKFLRDANFPVGPIFMRWLGYNRFGHKVRTLRRILNNLGDQRCVLVGDSGEQDLQIYRRVCDHTAHGDKVVKILIRHIPGSPPIEHQHPREHIYKTVDELREHLDFMMEPRGNASQSADDPSSQSSGPPML